jgi:hypothetical protein
MTRNRTRRAQTSGWTRGEHQSVFVEAWRDKCGDEPMPEAWHHRDGRTALVGREPMEADGSDRRWHISVRYGDPGIDGRVPSWDELVATAHELRPGIVFVVGIPPRSWWINVHPHVLHMWEVRDEALVASWRAERRGHEPT